MNKDKEQLWAALAIAMEDQGLDMDMRQLAALRIMSLKLSEAQDRLNAIAYRLGILVFVFVVLPLVFGACSVLGLV